jgi:hypothetical protein
VVRSREIAGARGLPMTRVAMARGCSSPGIFPDRLTPAVRLLQESGGAGSAARAKEQCEWKALDLRPAAGVRLPTSKEPAYENRYGALQGQAGIGGREERLIAQVFAQVARDKLGDGVSFVHVASSEAGKDGNPLVKLDAFKDFTAGIKERCEEAPVTVEMQPIGAYDAMDAGSSPA